MPVHTSHKHWRLQLYPESGPDQIAGVFVIDEQGEHRIPLGATLHARIVRPDPEINGVGLGTADLQPYKLQHAPPPAAWNTPGGVGPFRRQRVLVASGNGPLVPQQRQPIWVDFGAGAGLPIPAEGSLRQLGKAVHTVFMPGHPDYLPATKDADAHFFRVRWRGTVVAAAKLVAGLAAAKSASGSWPSDHKALVPGSLKLTFATGGASNTTDLYDDGKGRITGEFADGRVNYITGEWSLQFTDPAGETGDIDVDYEHECLYRPLDIFVEWDPLLAGN